MAVDRHLAMRHRNESRRADHQPSQRRRCDWRQRGGNATPRRGHGRRHQRDTHAGWQLPARYRARKPLGSCVAWIRVNPGAAFRAPSCTGHPPCAGRRGSEAAGGGRSSAGGAHREARRHPGRNGLAVQQKFCEHCTDDKLTKTASDLARSSCRSLPYGSVGPFSRSDLPRPVHASRSMGEPIGGTDTTYNTYPGSHVVIIEKPDTSRRR